MPRHRFTKSLPRLPENPYALFDSGLSPKWLMHTLYHKPISSTSDERLYSTSLLSHLRRKGVLVEEYKSIEKELKRRDDNDDDYGYIPPSFDTGTTLYLYKDNLVRIKQHDDSAISIDCYYAVGIPCIISGFSRYLIKEKGESRVSILVTRNGGLIASKVTFAPPEIPDLELNYGTGFMKTYELFVERLNQRKSGIILMHGSPGSGKSTFLKHLTSVIDREFVFCPVNLTDKLASPDFITLLMGKKEAVLILEDAEQAVQSRETSFDSSSVSTLLNLSDGILGSLLNICVIISYNFNRDGIDPALTRPGRLLLDVAFPALSIPDAQRLSKHLGHETTIKEPMTLAQIYNQNVETNFVPPVEKKKIGFHA